jgi:ABC-type lipoprotein export system ATPase subunit
VALITATHDAHVAGAADVRVSLADGRVVGITRVR